MSKNNYVEQRVKEALKKARAKYGYGWAYLSNDQHRGAVAMEVITFLTAQDEEFATGAALIRLQEVAVAALSAVDKEDYREPILTEARRSR